MVNINNPWLEPSNRQILSDFHKDSEDQNMSLNYWNAVTSEAFKGKILLQQRVEGIEEIIEPKPYFTRLRVEGHPIVPFTQFVLSRQMLEVCQVDEETGVAFPLTNLTIASRNKTTEPYRSMHGKFSFHLVNLLGMQAAKMAEISLVPIQSIR